jgi:hypothetical protein
MCTSSETCTAGVCGGGSTTNCDDGDLCTVDSCNGLTGCQHSSTPVDASSCFAAGKFSIGIKNANGPKSSVKWGWKKGEAVDNADIGTPTSTTTYALCIYDRQSDVPSLVGSYNIAAGSPPWTAKPGQAKYSDKAGASDGVTSVKIKASTDGKSSLKLKATGANLTLPPAFNTSVFFDVDQSLTVQMLNSEGACWTTDFTPGTEKKNDAAKGFKAVGPVAP